MRFVTASVKASLQADTFTMTSMTQTLTMTLVLNVFSAAVGSVSTSFSALRTILSRSFPITSISPASDRRETKATQQWGSNFEEIEHAQQQLIPPEIHPLTTYSSIGGRRTGGGSSAAWPCSYFSSFQPFRSYLHALLPLQLHD